MGNLNPLNWPGLFIKGLWALVQGWLSGFGKALAKPARELASVSLPDYSAAWWVHTFNSYFGLGLLTSVILLMLSGFLIGISSHPIEGHAPDILHPFKTFLFGLASIPALIVAILILDVVRQGAAAVGSDDSGDWTAPLNGLSLPTSAGALIMVNILAVVINAVLTIEAKFVVNALYIVPFIAMLAYALKPVPKLGTKLAQWTGAVLCGLFAALPFQILILRLGVFFVSNTPDNEAKLAVVLIVFGAAAFIPAVTIWWCKTHYDFSRLIGGEAAIEGKVKADIDSSKPLPVRQEEEVAAHVTSMQPFNSAATDGTTPTGASPQVLPEGQSSGNFLHDYRRISAGVESQAEAPATAQKLLADGQYARAAQETSAISTETSVPALPEPRTELPTPDPQQANGEATSERNEAPPEDVVQPAPPSTIASNEDRKE